MHCCNHCLLLGDALLCALSSTATLVHCKGWKSNFTSYNSVSIVDPKENPCTGILLRDGTVCHMAPPMGWMCRLVGFVWATPSVSLHSRLRRKVTETHPRTADKWLCIHSHVRWRHLATSSEPAPPPAPALLDTTSSHDLQLPRHQLHGPQQALKKTSTNTHLPTDLYSTHPSWADALRSTTLLCQPYLSTVGTSK